ncbi:hypothetical protein ABID21_001392 [Pseudorhizobium tarimense]|uniref:Uncharacterized protein n=1 Tax=Pseudorhizobium tarimense TaxID=1079109 RepID=A0ABV2H422_9HYPH
MNNRPAPPDDGAMPAMDEGLDERGFFAEQPPKPATLNPATLNPATLKRGLLAKPEEKQAHYHGHRDRLRARTATARWQASSVPSPRFSRRSTASAKR